MCNLFLVCDTLTYIDYGWFNMTPGISGNWSFGAIAEYSCITGYVLSNNAPLQCIQNGTSGKWSDIIPHCKLVDCGTNFTGPVNGNVTYGNETTYASEAFVNCSEGYWLNGSQTLNCTSDGTWKPQSATCNAIGKDLRSAVYCKT